MGFLGQFLLQSSCWSSWGVLHSITVRGSPGPILSPPASPYPTPHFHSQVSIWIMGWVEQAGSMVPCTWWNVECERGRGAKSNAWGSGLTPWNRNSERENNPRRENQEFGLGQARNGARMRNPLSSSHRTGQRTRSGTQTGILWNVFPAGQYSLMTLTITLHYDTQWRGMWALDSKRYKSERHSTC